MKKKGIISILLILTMIVSCLLPSYLSVAEDLEQPAESMTRKLSKGTVLYEDEKLKTEIGTLEKDALVILSESGEKSSSVFYAVEVNGEKEVKTAWVKNKALKDTASVS